MDKKKEHSSGVREKSEGMHKYVRLRVVASAGAERLSIALHTSEQKHKNSSMSRKLSSANPCVHSRSVCRLASLEEKVPHLMRQPIGRRLAPRSSCEQNSQLDGTPAVH